MTSEGSDSPTLEEIAEMDVEEDVLDAIIYGTSTRDVYGTSPVQAVWETTVDERTRDIAQGMRPETSIGFDVDDDYEITTDAIDEMVEQVAERHYQQARDRLKGQRPPDQPFIVRGHEQVRERLREEADATIDVFVEVYECVDCGLSRPVNVTTGGGSQVMECYGPCDGETDHVERDVRWKPVRLEFECPECSYETLMFEDPDEWPPECPECPPPPEGPDGIPVVPSKTASVDDVPGAVDATEALDELSDVSGVSESKAMSLIGAGIYSKVDLRRASMDEIREVDGIGQALAARIKAAVGDACDTDLILVDVRLKADVED